MPKVSVIIPTYNRAKLLPEALDSVLNQSYRDFEIIIVDDGSTDNTKEIIESYMNPPTRQWFDKLTIPRTIPSEVEGPANPITIKYIYQENKGPAAARNKGLEQAKGEYIAFQDSDDYWVPNKLEKQMFLFQANPHYCMIFSDMSHVSNGKLIFSSYFKEHKHSFSESNIYLQMLKSNFIYLQTVVIKKSCFQELGNFNEEYRCCEDYEMLLRIAKNKRVGFINEPLAIRNIHGSNLSYKTHLYLTSGLKIMEDYYVSAPPGSQESKLLERSMANLFSELGYYYFANGDLKAVQVNCIQSLKIRKFNFFALRYFILSSMPLRLLRILKGIKNKIKLTFESNRYA